MIKGMIGLAILAVLVAFWLIRGLLRTGRTVYAATVSNEGGAYVAQVREAYAQLVMDPDSLVSDARFPAMVQQAQGVMRPYEFALYNAVGIRLKDQISQPEPFPSSLDLSLMTGKEWADAGLIRKTVLADIVTHVQQELESKGLATHGSA